MHKDKLSIGIRGHVKAFSNKNGQVLNEHNAINVPDAPQVLARCLTNVDFNKNLDIITASGTFGTVDRLITSAEFTSPGTITLSTTFIESDFDGIINTLELKSSALGLVLADKTGIGVTKDSSSRVLVNWSITINITT